MVLLLVMMTVIMVAEASLWVMNGAVRGRIIVGRGRITILSEEFRVIVIMNDSLMKRRIVVDGNESGGGIDGEGVGMIVMMMMMMKSEGVLKIAAKMMLLL